MKSNLVLLALILASCQPEMPVTSSILVKGDGLTVPVNKELYGLTIEGNQPCGGWRYLCGTYTKSEL